MPLLLHGAAGADVAVIEGVMGLYDGRVGARRLRLHRPRRRADPHARSSSSSTSPGRRAPIGAVVHGMATCDPDRRRRRRDPQPGRLAPARRRGRRRRSTCRCSARSRRDDRLAVPVAPPRPGAGRRARRGRARRSTGSPTRIAERVDLDARRSRSPGRAPDLDDGAVGPGRRDGRRPRLDQRRARWSRWPAAGRSRSATPRPRSCSRAAGCDVVTFDPLDRPRACPTGTRGHLPRRRLPRGARRRRSPPTQSLRARAARRRSRPACRPSPSAPGCSTSAAPRRRPRWSARSPRRAAMTERLTLRYPDGRRAVADSLLTRAGERVTGHEFHRTHVDPARRRRRRVDASTARRSGFATPTLHASYLHTHWAGHPQLAQRFADAVARAVADPTPASHPLRHHGDVEVGDGLLDFAVNVYAGPAAGLAGRARCATASTDAAPTPTRDAGRGGARRAPRPAGRARCWPRPAPPRRSRCVARLRPWRRPVVVHPQFTEPHAALEQAGHAVTEVRAARRRFALDPAPVPDDADLVVVGNPTNPTGVLHPADHDRARLLRPGPAGRRRRGVHGRRAGRAPSRWPATPRPGCVVIRSLTKHWGIPGVRAGYVARRRRRRRATCAAAQVAVVGLGAGRRGDGRLRDDRGAGRVGAPRATTIADWREAPRGAASTELGIRARPVGGVVRAGPGRRRRARGAARAPASPYAGPTRSPASDPPGCGSRSARRDDRSRPGCWTPCRRCPATMP